MKKLTIFTLFFAFIQLNLVSTKTFSQDKDIPKELYIASTIPDSLKEKANSVVRYALEEDEVVGNGKKIEKHHSIVTILNEKGDREAIMEMGYNNKYDSFSDIVMRVYDKDGKLLKKYHKSDMYDGVYNEDGTLVGDERFLQVKHTVANYPTTIEMEYELTTTSLIDLRSWSIQANEQAVQHSYFHLTIDENAGFRYLNKNTGIVPKKTNSNGKDDYWWEVSNLKAFKKEEGAVNWKVFPRIDFAQKEFAFFGHPGNIDTWQNYGKWQKDLNADVNSLTPEREVEIRKMTDSIKNDKEKTKFLYQYLQKNMRYVSIQLGIGGLKPFPATFVDQKKYGDCKALANYMVALLKAVNIPAYYAKVRAGTNEESYDPTFPFDLSNHIIVCVPFKNDTTWLECTVSTQPFGKLGNFTENRNALIVTEDGGKLVNTPKSKMEENQFKSESHLTLNADGSAKCSLKIQGTGVYRDELIGLSFAKVDIQKEFLLSRYNIKQAPSSFLISPYNDRGDYREGLNLDYDKFCDIIAGDKQFYRPRIFDLCGIILPIEENRKFDFYFEQPLQKECITTIDLPAGFEVETLPVNQNLKSSNGTYENKYVYDAAKNQVISTAKFTITNQVIPAAKYTEMQVFLDAVAKAQNKKLVIRKKV